MEREEEMVMNDQKSACVSLGKCVGTTVRSINEKFSRAGELCSKSAQTFCDETRLIFARAGNLCKSVKNNSILSCWTTKQKDHFAQLGEEIYRLKGDRVKQIIKDRSVNKIVSNIKEYQNHINKVENEMRAQKKRMKEWVVYKHAISQLQNPQPRIRIVALRLLERLDKKSAISKVSQLLKDPEVEVRNRARQVLAKLTKQKQKSGGITNDTGRNDKKTR